MAEPVVDIVQWLSTIPEGGRVGVDDGGLTLRLVGDPEVHYEIGGVSDGYEVIVSGMTLLEEMAEMLKRALPLVEAYRQVSWDVGENTVCNVRNALARYDADRLAEDGHLSSDTVDGDPADYVLPSGLVCWIDLAGLKYTVHIANQVNTGTFVEVLVKDDVNNDDLMLGRIVVPEDEQ